MNKALLQQALDALVMHYSDLDYWDTRQDAMLALRQALAQPVPLADVLYVIETLIDHGNGKTRGEFSKAQRNKAIQIMESFLRPATGAQS